MSRGVAAGEMIGPRALIWLGLGVVLACLPLAFYLPIWLPLWTTGMAIWRLRLGLRQQALPPLAVRLALFVGGLALVVGTQGTMFGSDAAVALLSVLVGLKLIELRTMRDYLVAMFVGFFVILSFCFYDSSLGTMLYAFLPATCLLAGVWQVSSGRQSQMRWMKAVGGALRMMALAFPLTLVLFIFFPRVHGNFVQFGASQFGVTGFSDQVYPGSLARLTLSEELAFRVEMQAGLPEPENRYWRGVALLECKGLIWERGKQRAEGSRFLVPNKEVAWQRFTLEPHNRKWLFALDRPVVVPGNDTMYATQTFENERKVRRVKHYWAGSSMVRLPSLTKKPEDLQAALAVDFQPSEPVLALVARLREETGGDPRALIREVLAMFEADFEYTLSPGQYRGDDPVAEFLFDRRVGFCEHFAAAFGTLMRLSGVPSRLVVGYQGGRLNRHGGYLQVRQSDAHAWTEVWLESEGWVRIDPTSAVAPGRLQYGMEAFAEGGTGPEGSGTQASAANRGAQMSWLQDFSRSLGEGWDNLNYQWILLVVEFDGDEQRALLRQLGAKRGMEWVWGLVTLVLGGLFVIGLIALFLLRRRRKGDAVSRLAERFVRELRPLAGERPRWEPLSRYMERAGPFLPSDAAETGRKFVLEHAHVRYGSAASERGADRLKTLLSELKNQLPKGKNRS